MSNTNTTNTNTTTQAALPPDPSAKPPAAPALAKNADAVASLNADIEAQSKLDGSTAINAFSSGYAFETAQRMAQLLSKSTLVPKDYQGNLSNCLLAIEMASRIGASVPMVMQNLDIIHGRPGWRATFLIATVNSSKNFTPLRFRWEGKPGSDDWGCRAVAKDRETGEECVGALITIKMAKAEGWYSRNGSKWPNMPEQMLMYRASAFWTRVYSPETGLGMGTADEIEDMGPERAAALPATPVGMQAVPGAAVANSGRRMSLRTGPVIDVKPEPVGSGAGAGAVEAERERVIRTTVDAVRAAEGDGVAADVEADVRNTLRQEDAAQAKAKPATPSGQQLPLGGAAPKPTGPTTTIVGSVKEAVEVASRGAQAQDERQPGEDDGDESDEDRAARKAAEPSPEEMEAHEAAQNAAGRM